MLGWWITVYRLRQAPPPGTAVTGLAEFWPDWRPDGDRIASWQARVGGIRWLDELVNRGEAVGRGDGYPYQYLVRAGAARPFLVQRPDERTPGMHQFLDPEAIESIDEHEWVLAQVWDES